MRGVTHDRLRGFRGRAGRSGFDGLRDRHAGRSGNIGFGQLQKRRRAARLRLSQMAGEGLAGLNSGQTVDGESPEFAGRSGWLCAVGRCCAGFGGGGNADDHPLTLELFDMDRYGSRFQTLGQG